MAVLVQAEAIALWIRSGGFEAQLAAGTLRYAVVILAHLAAAMALRVAVTTLGVPGWRLALDGARRAPADWPLTVAVLTVLASAYTWGKLMIPHLNPRLWDGGLAALDRALCLGVNPNEVAFTIFAEGPRWAALALDRYYAAFVPTMLAGAAWFLTDTPARRRAFLAGFATLWSVGLWLYIAVPALGPAYAFRDFLTRIPGVFPLAAAAQEALMANYMRVLDLGAGPRALIAPTLGIAAMPSLHVATHFLLFLWALRTGSLLRTVFLVMTLLTLLGSVATEWHYLVDGLAGLALAVPAAGVAAAVLRWSGGDSG